MSDWYRDIRLFTTLQKDREEGELLIEGSRTFNMGFNHGSSGEYPSAIGHLDEIGRLGYTLGYAKGLKAYLRKYYGEKYEEEE